MKKKVTVLMVFAVACILLLSSCGAKKETQQPTASQNGTLNFNAKYNPPITVTVARMLNPNVKCPEGETFDNNMWTRAYEEKLGIKINTSWTSPDYQTFDTRINMAIASDSLPDIFNVYTTLFFRASAGGKCYDLTDLYQKYATQQVKDIENSAEGIALKTATTNGKLYAIAQPPDTVNVGDMIWIRNDWLKKLKLDPPKTIDDVVKIAKAFTHNDPDGNGQDDTYGFALDKDLSSFTGFANGFHAYRSIWVEKNGKLERSDVQPEMKTALAKMVEMYKDGCIDEEFCLRTIQDLKSDFADGTLGMMYGPYWYCVYPIHSSVETDPKADWQCYKLVSADDKPPLCQVETRVTGFLCASKNTKHPEALIKLINFGTQFLYDSKTPREYYHKDGMETFWHNICYLSDSNFNLDMHKKMLDVYKTGDTSVLSPIQKGYYDDAMQYEKTKNPAYWEFWREQGPDGNVEIMRYYNENNLKYYSRGYDRETPAWVENGPNLHYKSIEYFSNIIAGQKPIDEFDNWVKYFYDNGGQKCTDEINTWWQAQNPKLFSDSSK